MTRHNTHRYTCWKHTDSSIIKHVATKDGYRRVCARCNPQAPATVARRLTAAKELSDARKKQIPKGD